MTGMGVRTEENTKRKREEKGSSGRTEKKTRYLHEQLRFILIWRFR